MDEIKKIYKKYDDEQRKKWNRSLPLQDTLDDRWERAKRLKFGKKTSIYNSSFVFGKVIVGENTWIGPNVVLDGLAAKLQIGNNCSISAGVQIYTHDSINWALSGGKLKYVIKPVLIGSNNYIGSLSIILPGSKIGSHCLIAAQSLINCEVEDYSIYSGIPAKKIGYIDISKKFPKRIYFKK